MDPITLIGAIAAVAGLVDVGVKLCITLKDMAKFFSSAPDAIFLMNRGVSSLVSLLQQLQAALEEGKSNDLALSLEARINLHNILQNCNLVLESLETILDKFQHYPKGLEGASATVTKIKAIKLRFRWMIEESEVVKIHKSLDAHVAALQLTLTVTITLVAAIIKRDTTEIIRRLEDLSFNLKRTATLTSETVVRPVPQIPGQLIIHNQPTTPAAQHEIETQIQTAVVVEHAAVAELHSVSSNSSHETTIIPTIVKPNEPESTQNARPSLQHASASRLTVSNQKGLPPGRSRSPRRHPPVKVTPGRTLFVAARAGNKDIFLRILRDGAKITEVESDGTTVLQAAAEENQLGVVLSLLFFGADPNLGGGQMTSPILAATDKQHVQVVAALLEAGADPSAVHPESWPYRRSAFHNALYHQNSKILSMLLGAGADPTCVPGLLKYACKVGTLESVKQLLDAGLDINNSSDSETALRVAVARTHTEIVKFLLERGADSNITFPNRFPHERSPLFSAVYYQNSKILSMLLGAGADPEGIPGLLPYVAENNDLQCVKIMLEEGNANVDSVNDHLGTALQVAAAKGQRDTMIYLLDCEADPNIEGGRYGSALNAAITNGYEDCVAELLGGGIDAY